MENNINSNDISDFAKEKLSSSTSSKEKIIKKGRSRLTPTTHYDKNYRRRKIANNSSYIFNALSVGGAVVGLYFLIKPNSLPLIIAFISCCCFVLGLEYLSRELSDDHWDAVFYDKVKITSNFGWFLLVFIINTSLTCCGVYLAYLKGAEPNPVYVELSKRIEEKKKEKADLLTRNDFLQNSETSYQKNAKTGKIEMRWNQEDELKKNGQTVLNLIAKISEMEKGLPLDTSILTGEHKANVLRDALILFMAFLGFSIMYQVAMRYRSKFDYLVNIEENRELYLLYVHLKNTKGNKGEINKIYASLTDEKRVQPFFRKEQLNRSQGVNF